MTLVDPSRQPYFVLPCLEWLPTPALAMALQPLGRGCAGYCNRLAGGTSDPVSCLVQTLNPSGCSAHPCQLPFLAESLLPLMPRSLELVASGPASGQPAPAPRRVRMTCLRASCPGMVNGCAFVWLRPAMSNAPLPRVASTLFNRLYLLLLLKYRAACMRDTNSVAIVSPPPHHGWLPMVKHRQHDRRRHRTGPPGRKASGCFCSNYPR
jgi:hypothetical protein